MSLVLLAGLFLLFGNVLRLLLFLFSLRLTCSVLLLLVFLRSCTSRLD